MQQASRNAVRILRCREHAVVILCYKLNASILKPLIGSTIVELLEEPLQ